MSDLIKSLEKSVEFLRERYPANHTLLVNLEAQLKSLKTKNPAPNETFTNSDNEND